MSSAKSGVNNGFTLTAGFDGEVKTPTAATDAKLQVGGADADGGYSVTSDSNTFSNLISGTSITVTKENETGVTVDVNADTGAISAKMKALVDAANSALGQITSQTRYDPTNKTGSPLTGDFAVRQIAQKVLSAVGGGITDFGSASGIGISLTRDGTLKFDAATFETAYKADPDKIKAAATTFSTGLSTLSDTAQTDVTNMVNGRNSLIKNMNDQIDNWDIRLATRKASLSKQFAGLETSLSSMKNQSSWLSSQIAAL